MIKEAHPHTRTCVFLELALGNAEPGTADELLWNHFINQYTTESAERLKVSALAIKRVMDATIIDIDMCVTTIATIAECTEQPDITSAFRAAYVEWTGLISELQYPTSIENEASPEPQSGPQVFILDDGDEPLPENVEPLIFHTRHRETSPAAPKPIKTVGDLISLITQTAQIKE